MAFEFRNSVIVNDIDDFNDICRDILSDFVDGLCKEERFFTDEYNDEYNAKVFTDRASELISRYRTRLKNLSVKMFGMADTVEYFDADPYNFVEV